MATITTGASGAGAGLLDRERIIAQPGFNRWLVPPAALASQPESAPASVSGWESRWVAA